MVNELKTTYRVVNPANVDYLLEVRRNETTPRHNGNREGSRCEDLHHQKNVFMVLPNEAVKSKLEKEYV